MYLRIDPDKIRPFEYLLSSYLKKDKDTSTPQCCLFLGAGCSINSGISSAKVIIDLCKELAFCSTHVEGYNIIEDDFQNHEIFLRAVGQFCNSKKDEFEKFVQNKESTFKLTMTDSFAIERMPISLKDDFLDDKKGGYLKDYIFKDQLYSYWFNEFDQDPRKRQELIEKLIEDKKPGGEYVLLANIIAQGKLNNIFTTNFDDLLNEAILVYTNKKARVYSSSETASFIQIKSKKPNIIKLHGDYLFENIKNLSNETHSLDFVMKSKFEETLNSQDLIVIGYAGADYSIMTILEALKQRRQFALLWCGKDPEKLHWRVRNLINTTSNSFFIQVNDFETFVLKLWSQSKEPPVNLSELGNERSNELTIILEKLKSKIPQTEGLSGEEKDDLLSSIEFNEFYSLAEKETDYVSKLHLINKAIEIKPNDVDSLNCRGNTYMILFKYWNARKDFEKALEIDDEYYPAMVNIAYLIYQIKEENEYDLAYKYLDRALSIAIIPFAYSVKGLIHYLKGENKEALDSLNKAVVLGPTMSNSYFLRGYYYAEIADYDSALKDYMIAEKLIDSTKMGMVDKAMLFNNIAVCYRKRKNFTEALKYINMAKEVDGNVGNIYGTLALIYSDQNDTSKFFTYLETALEKGCPVWLYENDPGLAKHINNDRYKKMIRKYKK